MPKAITFLGNKVNLSIFDNTITVYEKSTHPVMMTLVKSETLNTPMSFSQFLLEAPRNDSPFSHFMEHHEMELEHARYVYRNDKEHDRYHQDSFNWKDEHCHIQFGKTITQEMLEQKLKIFEKYSIISSLECTTFMSVFKEANTLSPKDSVKKEDSQATFSGFKKGFLQNGLFSTPKQKSHVLELELEPTKILEI